MTAVRTPAEPMPLQDQLPRGVFEAPFRALDGHSIVLWAVTSKGHILGWRKVPTLAEYAPALAALTASLDAADPPSPPLRIVR